LKTFRISRPWIVSIIMSLVLSFGFFLLFQNVLKCLRIARINGLSTIQPGQMDYFWRLSFYHRILDREIILNFIDFYDSFIKYYPTYSDDDYGILAFCYYYSGNIQKSINLFELAFQKGPSYFWYPYDLSILYIKTHQYVKAVKLLKYAIQLDPVFTLHRINKSHGFEPLIERHVNSNEIIAVSSKHLSQGYTLASALLGFLTLVIQNHNDDAAIQKLRLDLYVF